MAIARPLAPIVLAVMLIPAAGEERAAAAAVANWPAPRTLVTAGHLDFFAQDGSWIVWSDGSQRCPRMIQLRNLSTNRTYSLLRGTSRTSHTCGAGDVDSRAALARDRALWVVVEPGLTMNIYTVSTASLRSREHWLPGGGEVPHVDVGDDDEVPAPFEFAAAGDGRVLVYSLEDGVRRAGTSTDLLPNTSGAYAVAASGKHFALARRVEIDGAARYEVQRRDWATARAISSITRVEDIEALTLDGSRLGLLVAAQAGRRIEIVQFDGTVLRSVRVPRSAAPELSLAGRRLVFRTGRTIRILDTAAGTHSVLARAEGDVIGLSIDGRRVAWGEKRYRGVVRAVTLPE